MAPRIIHKTVSKVKKLFGRKAEKDDKADKNLLLHEDERAPASHLMAIEQIKARRSKPLPPTPSPSDSPTPSPPAEREERELV